MPPGPSLILGAVQPELDYLTLHQPTLQQFNVFFGGGAFLGFAPTLVHFVHVCLGTGVLMCVHD